ncbi:YadA C-terminal domain-containing protein [Providencia manganoxydans]|uniref:YadA C-terminal domain-containing protein n=1 Tax=Providencia manganoxydans TaxID=2923283 RepID=UPI0029BFCD4E|nr:YadA C-terminal domain-containing protein [Providencia manganoxydans]MDX4946434.1 YadA C-terminal domain-containing protein [Providencia manganoxydans]
MNKVTLVVTAVSVALLSHSAIADVSWAGWNNNIYSENSHADAAKTSNNLNVLAKNVDSVNADLQNSKAAQNSINQNQSLVNQTQSNINQSQAATNQNQAMLNHKQDVINNDQAVINTKQDVINKDQAVINTKQDGINKDQAVINTKQDGINKDQTVFNNNQIAVNNQQKVINKQVDSRLNQLDGRVNSLDRRVDSLNNELKRGLASQSALSGLFQPYNVGKFNVSMALGGYKSNTALALGSGYRVNENIAFKTGVASNTEDFKGVSYNAAVNFEW